MAKFRQVWSHCWWITLVLLQVSMTTSGWGLKSWPTTCSSCWPSTSGSLPRPLYPGTSMTAKTLLLQLMVWSMGAIFFVMGHPSHFCLFFLFKHKFYRKILYRRQRDSNLDCQSRRQACWPLDHLHGPMGAIFGSLNEFVSYYTIVCHNRDRSVRTWKGLCLVWRYKCEVFYFNSNSIKNTSKH